MLTEVGINPVFYSWRDSSMQNKPPVQIFEMAVRLVGVAGLAGGSCLVSEYSGFITLYFQKKNKKTPTEQKKPWLD